MAPFPEEGSSVAHGCYGAHQFHSSGVTTRLRGTCCGRQLSWGLFGSTGASSRSSLRQRNSPAPTCGPMGLNVSVFRGPLALWDFSCKNPEKNLSQKLQGNKFFPFQVMQPKVFVMEYYKDMLWKGALVFVVSLVASVFYFRAEMGSQNFSGFFIYGMIIGLWLIISNMHKRRLIINHNKELYQFYIKGCLWQEGPLYQIYVRLVAQRDAYGKLFYSLIINGYRLEVLTLANLSSKFEQIDILGRRIARNLNLNYFDYEDISTRHVIRHRPPEDQEEEEEFAEDQYV
ncbi:cation channel sperm-associated auxiliary subunit TMEM249 [Sphaerodactylus townsendi]|uniref:cation channel sperm-associated auxiliary subunit TMEM249 n=1 Tax=Sphaerodactylus townsendi TaxID=933632 RepID=UPI00202625D4|nr:cation channel sperm-associated auxiliary subunit TMEM249 [Sphaerodactylus townsendi]